MSTATVIANAFELPPVETQPVPSGTHCAITGTPISEGVSTRSVISSATADIADTFRSQWLSADAARAFSNSRIVSNIYATADGRLYQPTVAPSESTPNRPVWRVLIPTLQLGECGVTIVTSNFQRRLWPRAALSAVGTHWRVLFVDGSIDQLLVVNYADLVECLRLIEIVYGTPDQKGNLSITKDRIRTTLLDFNLISHYGLPLLRNYENALIPWRNRSEFPIALFIAQREVK